MHRCGRSAAVRRGMAASRRPARLCRQAHRLSGASVWPGWSARRSHRPRRDDVPASAAAAARTAGGRGAPPPSSFTGPHRPTSSRCSPRPARCASRSRYSSCAATASAGRRRRVAAQVIASELPGRRSGGDARSDLLCPIRRLQPGPCVPLRIVSFRGGVGDALRAGTPRAPGSFRMGGRHGSTCPLRREFMSTSHIRQAVHLDPHEAVRGR